jgi:hypothetical protein
MNVYTSHSTKTLKAYKKKTQMGPAYHVKNVAVKVFTNIKTESFSHWNKQISCIRLQY